MKTTYVSWFLRSAGVLLLATGGAKLVSVPHDAEVFQYADPLLFVPFSILFLGAGLVEVAVGVCCFSKALENFALYAVATVSTLIAVYRIGLWWIDYTKPCTCLGNLSDALHLSPQTADNAMVLTLIFLLAGSYAALALKLGKSTDRAGASAVG